VTEQGPMTEAMYYILLALLRPGHGYGMMQRIKELSGGRLEMGPGTLYGVLSRMNREGWIVLTGEEGRRKNYAITQAGKAALLTEYERIKRLAADGRLLEEVGK
jgi:DNA-binding PadR family transcriptional regulator